MLVYVRMCVCVFMCITQIVFGIQFNWLTSECLEGHIRFVHLITGVRMFHIRSVHELHTYIGTE